MHNFIRSITRLNVFAWAHAGRVCPVLTTGGAVGRTEKPNTQATSLPLGNPTKDNANEALLPGRPHSRPTISLRPVPGRWGQQAHASHMPLEQSKDPTNSISGMGDACPCVGSFSQTHYTTFS